MSSVSGPPTARVAWLRVTAEPLRSCSSLACGTSAGAKMRTRRRGKPKVRGGNACPLMSRAAGRASANLATRKPEPFLRGTRHRGASRPAPNRAPQTLYVLNATPPRRLPLVDKSDISRGGTPLPNERLPSERMAHHGDDCAGRSARKPVLLLQIGRASCRERVC